MFRKVLSFNNFVLTKLQIFFRFQFQPVYEQAKKDLKTDEWETELAGIEKIVTIARKAPEVKSKRPMSHVPNTVKIRQCKEI